MDKVTFDDLVALAKRHLKSPVDVFFEALTDRQREPYLRNRITESETSREAWDSLCLISRDLLKKGHPLPQELGQWVAQVLDDLVHPSATQPRPPKGDSGARTKVLIYSLIYSFTENFGLFPTRGNATILPKCCAQGGTACDVVGRAANLNYKNAEKIWNQRDPLFRSYRRDNK